ncbi:putative nuclease HARBI1 [Manduca sexta]|uniref:putative nuclease HARBI1 n=1 Tax=Manduca sexta TaxID=7130 RepID=UPI00188E976C|nr:putative nuclease HARBI1 [Manduca sexta]
MSNQISNHLSDCVRLSLKLASVSLSCVIFYTKMDINMVDSVDIEDIEAVELLETPRRPNRNRVRLNPFIDLSDEDFRQKYRFTKSFAMKIVDLLKDPLTRDTRGCPVSPEIQVVCALRSWARHEIQDDTADLHGVSQPFISKICKKIAGPIAGISHRFIKMPATLAEQEEAMRKFHRIANFPSVIGAIDCTYIRVKKLCEDGGQIYINRKGFPSINVQVVCDANLKIIDIVARWHGSVHDSRIFRESRLKQRFEAGAFSGILLGDSGYACTPYLFTPLLNTSTPQEERYNSAHINTRNAVERCFGLWKQRFRCLLRGLYCDIETARKTIVACAVLHNIAIDMKEDVFSSGLEDEVNRQSHAVVLAAENNVRGNIRRRQFIERHF